MPDDEKHRWISRYHCLLDKLQSLSIEYRDGQESPSHKNCRKIDYLIRCTAAYQSS
ncbi:hypothetical protein QUB56_25545 [Microcoleus sp. AR_TQ3_B6]|uniref:hypothetical protein n=1 Tax=Microcoleus sp. AR_TQ3_B6 TaxID=3055284 RepID=UPI002FCEA126